MRWNRVIAAASASGSSAQQRVGQPVERGARRQLDDDPMSGPTSAWRRASPGVGRRSARAVSAAACPSPRLAGEVSGPAGAAGPGVAASEHVDDCRRRLTAARREPRARCGVAWGATHARLLSRPLGPRISTRTAPPASAEVACRTRSHRGDRARMPSRRRRVCGPSSRRLEEVPAGRVQRREDRQCPIMRSAPARAGRIRRQSSPLATHRPTWRQRRDHSTPTTRARRTPAASSGSGRRARTSPS